MIDRDLLMRLADGPLSGEPNAKLKAAVRLIGWRSALSVPMLLEGRIVGAVTNQHGQLHALGVVHLHVACEARFGARRPWHGGHRARSARRGGGGGSRGPRRNFGGGGGVVVRSEIEQLHIVNAFVFELSKVERLDIRERMVANGRQTDVVRVRITDAGRQALAKMSK